MSERNTSKQLYIGRNVINYFEYPREAFMYFPDVFELFMDYNFNLTVDVLYNKLKPEDLLDSTLNHDFLIPIGHELQNYRSKFICLNALLKLAYFMEEEVSFQMDVVLSTAQLYLNVYRRNKKSQDAEFEDFMTDLLSNFREVFSPDRNAKTTRSNSFTGTQLVDWLITSGWATSRDEAVDIANQMMRQDAFKSSVDESFKDKDTTYFIELTECVKHRFKVMLLGPNRSGKSTLFSLLPQKIQKKNKGKEQESSDQNEKKNPWDVIHISNWEHTTSTGHHTTIKSSQSTDTLVPCSSGSKLTQLFKKNIKEKIPDLKSKKKGIKTLPLVGIKSSSSPSSSPRDLFSSPLPSPSSSSSSLSLSLSSEKELKSPSFSSSSSISLPMSPAPSPVHPINENVQEFNSVTISLWNFEEKLKYSMSNNISLQTQEYMYFGHRFFLTERCTMYLVVFNMTDLRLFFIDHYIQSIVKYAPKSTIVLVGTHADMLNSTRIGQIEGQLESRYKKIHQILKFFAISGKNVKNVQSLKNFIHESALKEFEKLTKKSPYYDKEFFNHCNRVDERLDYMRNTLGLDSITIDQLYSIMDENQITTEEDKQQTLKILVETGAIVNYDHDELKQMAKMLGNAQNFCLRDKLSSLVILNPNFFTKIIYHLRNLTQNLPGVLISSQIAAALSDAGLSDEYQDEFRLVMFSYNLQYCLQGTRDFIQTIHSHSSTAQLLPFQKSTVPGDSPLLSRTKMNPSRRRSVGDSEDEDSTKSGVKIPRQEKMNLLKKRSAKRVYTKWTDRTDLQGYHVASQSYGLALPMIVPLKVSIPRRSPNKISNDISLYRVFQFDMFPSSLLERVALQLLVANSIVASDPTQRSLLLGRKEEIARYAKKWDTFYWWQKGLFFKVDSYTEKYDVRIRIRENESSLVVEISGETNYAIKGLRLVVDNIVQILAIEYDHISYEQVIPCICAKCQMSRNADLRVTMVRLGNSGVFTLNNCESAVREGHFFLLCPLTNTKVRIDSVAPDIAMLDVPHIPYSDINKIKVIAETLAGKIWKANYNNNIVAIKEIKLPEDEELATETTRDFRREVWLSSFFLNSPYVVGSYGYTKQGADTVAMVMEFVPYGNLYNYLTSSEKLTYQVRVKMALDVAKGMRTLHSCVPTIIHHDLKSLNVFMSSKDPNEVMLKVGDFGESRTMFSYTKRDSVSNPIWLAPEVLNGSVYTPESDVFSYGIIMWELIARELPYSEYPEGKSKWSFELEDAIIKKGLRPNIDKFIIPNITGKETSNACCKEYAAIVQNCYDELLQRPSFNFIVKKIESIYSGILTTLNEVDS
eukprot:TRINITY_DN5752_c0_g1_i1.p1 TRINITY_DN5752_c0_g1~~TRINITY_DN5752_c0_g1_i1.p1  ORF type:complete len:1317 (+),score=193.44 TRINITY_DN5752_c0_g1_i1:42-3992(+)